MRRSPYYLAGVQAARVKLAVEGPLGSSFDLAGLGLLAIPALHGLMRDDSQPESHDTKKLLNQVELGGLGLLAVPSIVKLLRR